MDAAEQSYYSNYRCANAPADAAPLCAHFGVEVAHAGESRGKIVRATRAIPAGSVAWVEEPLVGMAHLSSARLCLGSCCARCLRSVGTVQAAWERISTVEAEDEAAARAAEARKKNKNKKKTTKGKAKDANEEAAVTAAAEESAATVKESIHLPSDLPQLLPFFSATNSSSSSPTLPSADLAPVPCTRGCGEVYCSVQCRDLAFTHSHELLCPALISPSSSSSSSSPDAAAPTVDPAYTRLLKHAASNNEIFLLAAQAVAQATLLALRNMSQQPEVQRLLATPSSSSSSSSAAPPSPEPMLPFALRLHAALQSLPMAAAESFRVGSLESCVSRVGLGPFGRFCGGVWWEHVSVPPALDFEDEEDEQEYRQTLCGVAEQSLSLLGQLAASKLHQATDTATAAAAAASDSSPSPSPPPPSWEDLLASLGGLDEAWRLSFFGRILSSFERNNIGFHAPTDLGMTVEAARRQLASFRDADDIDTAEKKRHDLIQSLGGAEAWTEMHRRVSSASGAAASAGSVEGTGLFVVGCCMNHSCEPNITLRMKQQSHTGGDEHYHEEEEEEEANERNDARVLAHTCAIIRSGHAAAAAAAASAASPSPPLPAAVTGATIPAALVDRSAMFVALRDIAAGEELNISYISLLQPRAEVSATSAVSSSSPEEAAEEEVGFEARQQQLQAYDFVCRCSKCQREAGTREERAL